ncbi:MAG: SLATT domain-containing protein [Chloroflexota bacterium]|nr:SLATT domain-containing protein [Chloroflexota bacterium]
MTNDVELRRELWREANRVFVDAEYTGRQHMLAGQRWRTKATRIGLPVTIITAAASAGAGLSALLGWGTAPTVILGFIGALAGAVQAFFKPDDQAEAHSVKGNAIIALRNDARRFMNIDLQSSISTDALVDRARLLGTRYDALRAQEPLQLPPDAYAIVKAAIARGDYDHENDPLWRDPPF